MSKQLKVTLFPPQSSNHNLSEINRLTMAPGVLYPVYVKEVVPGDIISNLKVESLIKTQNLLAPVMGSFNVQFDYFISPTRIYTPSLRLNSNNFDPTSVDLPTFNYQFQEGSFKEDPKYNLGLDGSNILCHLGFPAGFIAGAGRSGSRSFNAVPLIMYYDIFRNWYANVQEDDFYFFTGGNYTGEAILDSKALSVLNESIETITNTDGVVINSLPFFNDIVDFPESYHSPLCGLVCRTYRNSLMSSWLNSAQYQSVLTKSKMVVNSDSSDGYLTYNQIIESSHFYDYLNSSLVSGGRFGDWIRATFGVNPKYKLDIPMLLGTTSTNIVFDDVVQTTGYETDNLGQLGGRGHAYTDGAPINHIVMENGYLMIIASIVPNEDYYQGIDPYLFKTMYSDLFNPKLDNLGFQTLPAEWLCALPQCDDYTSGTIKDIASMAIGYQPAWSEYTTSWDKLHGLFTSSLNYWTLGRDFQSSITESDGSVVGVTSNYTSYIFPNDYNQCFAQNSVNDENFLVQIKINNFMRRPISKQVMPKI